MLTIIATNYPGHNLLALRHYLKQNDCSLIVEFIIRLAECDIDIPEWDNQKLQLSQLHCAHLLARSVLCMNGNQFDCIGIYDKLVDPPRPNHVDEFDFIRKLIISNSLDPDEMFMLSIEKLHFIFKYFDRIMKIGMSGLSNPITITRQSQICSIVDSPLSPISFYQGHMKYSDAIKVDFANSNIGGGVLKHGCCQEEIIFLNNPELIGLMSVVDTLGPIAAISVDGITQYSKANYYGFDLEYAGNYIGSSKQRIIMMDAIDYRNRPGDQNLKSTKGIEIQKAMNGFSLAGSGATIATGHWGCGAFKGNPKLKFMIQWLAASLSNTQLKYYIGDDRATSGLSVFYHQFKKHSTQDLYNELLSYTCP